MRRVFLLLAIAATALPLVYAPRVHAEQGYARVEYVASKTNMAVGEEFTVSVYIVGQYNETGPYDTQYGTAEMSIEGWYQGDPNPKGWEFVRFDASGSDFPISNSQGVKTGMYNYQCRYFTRSAAADMTGRRLFGRFVLRSLNPGTYGIWAASPCRNVIESLTGNWGIIWDYSGVYVTVNKPAQTTQTAPGSSGNTSSNSTQYQQSGNKTISSQAAASNSNKPGSSTAYANKDGQAAMNNQAVSGSHANQKATEKLSLAKTGVLKNAAALPQAHKGWTALLLVPVGLLALMTWKYPHLIRLANLHKYRTLKARSKR